MLLRVTDQIEVSDHTTHEQEKAFDTTSKVLTLVENMLLDNLK